MNGAQSTTSTFFGAPFVLSCARRMASAEVEGLDFQLATISLFGMVSATFLPLCGIAPHATARLLAGMCGNNLQQLIYLASSGFDFSRFAGLRISTSLTLQELREQLATISLGIEDIIAEIHSLAMVYYIDR